MDKRDINLLVRRSELSLPADKEKFIEKAWTRNADVVRLDLEDGVSPQNKALARSMIRDAVDCVSKGGSEVIIRVNNDEELLWDDLSACVIPGVSSIGISKVESPEQVIRIEKEIGRLEQERGMEYGSVTTVLAIESARGYINMREIAEASERGIGLALGAEDFTREIGMELVQGDELLFARTQMLIVAAAYHMQPKGLLGTMSNYKDLDGMYRMAVRSYQFGFRGSTCIHPNQIDVCNRAFRPGAESVEWSRRVVEAMNEALEKGNGATSVDGRMVDKPVAVRAQRILDRHEAIEKKELYKRECRIRQGFDEE